MLNSAIYQGVVSHRRMQPLNHEFKYHVFMLYLDLDELDQVFCRSPIWSVQAFNIASFHSQHYLPSDGDGEDTDLKTRAQQLVFEKLGVVADGPVRLLTNGSYFGFCFNPASFYYCFDSNDQLIAIITEINNTPWNERTTYVTSANNGRTKDSLDKRFHVSPFNPMDMLYEWNFSLPQQHLGIHMVNLKQDEKHFDATLSFQRSEASASNLHRTLLKFPFITLKVLLGIYWQAAKLWFKRAPIYDHPETKGDT